MKRYKHFKVLTLPTELEPNSIYYVKNGDSVKLYITDNQGNAVPHEGGEIDDSNLVHKTGNETIEGEKEFTSPVTTTGIFLKHEYFPISKDGHTGIASNSGYINIEAKDSEGTSRAAQIILPEAGARREYTLPTKSGTVALLDDVQGSQRTVKAVPNLSQYTIQASDFDKILVLTASNGATIGLILNAGVAPVNGELQVISINNNKIRFVAGDGVDVFLPEGATDTTVSRGWLGGVVFATDRISINGSLETTGGGTAITNITQIANRSYNDLQDLPLTDLATYENASNTFSPSDIGKIIAISGDLNISESDIPVLTRIEGFNDSNIPVSVTIDNETSLLALPRGATNKIKPNGRFIILKGLYFILWGDLIEEYSIRQSPNGTLWKVSVDNSGNEVITAL